MLALFNEVKKQISFKKKHPTIESVVFQSMKLAMVATLLGCALVTAKTYIGANINCVTGFSKNEHKAIETYCFIASTFSLVNFTENPSAETVYPGVGPGEEDEMQRHAYYQWVPMMLAIQASVLYFPRWIWKEVMDKKKFKTVLGSLDVITIGSTASKIDVSAKYMASSINTHQRYAFQFLLCEIIAFAISLGNLFVTNTFLGGHFFGYGTRALSYIGGDVTDIENPLNEVFPKITKCTWRKFGPSGSIQTYDSMCVLPLNIVNEKTYVLLWLVYIITMAVISAVLLFHFAIVVSWYLRDWLLRRHLRSDQAHDAYLQLKHKLNYGDWFFMYNLSCRMVGKYFEDWIIKVAEEVDK